jgi:alpha-L-rhamnosidase
LGISHIDYLHKEVTVCFADLPLDCCSGSIPVGDEVISLEWERKGDEIHYAVKIPAGYRVKVENAGHFILSYTTVVKLKKDE